MVLAGGKSLWTARVASRSNVRPGQPVELAVHTANLQFFDPATGLAIGHPEAVRRVSRFPRRGRQRPASDRAMTSRWIWLVPSTICRTLASRR